MSDTREGLILLQRFELVRKLGSGGAGEVWLANDGQRDVQVALKILDSAVGSDQARQFELESRKSRALVHPHILRVHEFHRQDNTAFIVMDLATGGTLRDRRGAGQQSLIPLLRQVAGALEYAHRQGVIHRDLKPANVLLDDQGNCQLADFGVAAWDEDQPRGGGSLPYISPQQLDGELASPADDVYGFGALAWEMFTGAPPFHPEPTPERVREEVPARLDRDAQGQPLPTTLVQLIHACLAKGTASRPAGMGAVAAVLETLDMEAAGGAGDDSIQLITLGLK